MMELLREFTDLLCGTFDNTVQLQRLAAEGITGYPEARHVNTRINDRIDHLPEGFAGEFVLEESYYTVNGRTNAMPHLFLFTQEGDGIRLTSYEMPEGFTKETLTAAGLGRLDYRTLRVSPTFTPAIYHRNGSWFEGGSESMFTPALKFCLYERFSREVLEVSESMEKDGRRIFGYDLPLEYRRTGC